MTKNNTPFIFPNDVAMTVEKYDSQQLLRYATCRFGRMVKIPVWLEKCCDLDKSTASQYIEGLLALKGAKGFLVQPNIGDKIHTIQTPALWKAKVGQYVILYHTNDKKSSFSFNDTIPNFEKASYLNAALYTVKSINEENPERKNWLAKTRNKLNANADFISNTNIIRRVKLDKTGNGATILINKKELDKYVANLLQKNKINGRYRIADE